MMIWREIQCRGWKLKYQELVLKTRQLLLRCRLCLLQVLVSRVDWPCYLLLSRVFRRLFIHPTCTLLDKMISYQSTLLNLTSSAVYLRIYFVGTSNDYLYDVGAVKLCLSNFISINLMAPSKMYSSAAIWTCHLTICSGYLNTSIVLEQSGIARIYLSARFIFAAE
jgi:hypothetical protein